MTESKCFLCKVIAIFLCFLMQPFVYAEETSSTDIAPPVVKPNEPYLLYQAFNQTVNVDSSDNPYGHGGNSDAIILSSLPNNTNCAPGFTPSVKATLNVAGSSSGTDYNEIIGFGVDHAQYYPSGSPVANHPFIIYHAYTWYSRGEGNASTGHMNFQVYCVPN